VASIPDISYEISALGFCVVNLWLLLFGLILAAVLAFGQVCQGPDAESSEGIWRALNPTWQAAELR
jgi:hypothetical protein